MLPAAHRMRAAADFTETTRLGAKGSFGPVVVYLHQSIDDAAPRVGLIVGKAVGGSVQRHRAARRLRAALAPLLDGLPEGSRLVVRALPGADTDPDLPQAVRRALTRAQDRSRERRP